MSSPPFSADANNLYRIRIGEIWRFLWTQSASYWLICIYLFFEYVRPQSIYPVIAFLPWARIVIILCVVAFVLEGNRPRMRGQADPLLLLFTFVVVASAVMAYSPATAFEALPVFLSWVLIYFLIINIVNTEKRFLVFMLSFLLYNLKMSQHGTLSWAQNGFAFRSMGVTGAPGWFQNSGEFGIEMTVFLPLSTFFIIALWRHWGPLKTLFFALFPITAIMGMVASSSRGALVGGGAVALWMLLKSKRKVAALVVVALVAVATIAIIPPEQMMRLADSGEDKTSTDRIERWKMAIEFGNDFPFLGIGYNNWIAYTISIGNRRGLPHNIFLDALAELGYTGLLSFLLLIGATFLINSRTRRRSGRVFGPKSFPYYMAHGLDGALVGLLVSGSFVSVLYYPYFWINLAMTTALHGLVRSEELRRSKGDPQHLRGQQPRAVRSAESSLRGAPS